LKAETKTNAAKKAKAKAKKVVNAAKKAKAKKVLNAARIVKVKAATALRIKAKELKVKADRRANIAAREVRAKSRKARIKKGRAESASAKVKTNGEPEKGDAESTAAKGDAESTSAKVKTNGESPEKGDAESTAQSTNKDYFAFAVNENVSVAWDNPDVRYHAQICRRVVTDDGPCYDVFYPEDSEDKRGVPESDILESDITTGFWSKTRDQYIGETFVNPPVEGDGNKEGEYTVVRFDEEHVNKYMCQHTVSGDEVMFCVGFVLRTLQTSQGLDGPPHAKVSTVLIC
jgi:hypothetical protein